MVPQQNGSLNHPQDIDAPLRIAAQRKITAYRQQYADNQNISFLPAIVSTSTRMHGEFLRLLFLHAHRETEAHCRWNVIANEQLGSTSVQARGILQRHEEQSRTCGCQSSSVEDQPQCPGLWHSSTPNARSLSHSPSAPPPSFTQSPCPPCSLVRDGQIVHTGLGSSSLVSHVLHYPPPPTRTAL